MSDLQAALPILDTMIERQTLTGVMRVRDIVRAALLAASATEEPTEQDIVEAIGFVTPLIDPRLSEVPWDQVALELAKRPRRAASATDERPREAPCTRCGSDWHYTDECTGPDIPVGAYVASALMAANIPSDSGEDVERFLDELARRGYGIVAKTRHPSSRPAVPEALDAMTLGRAMDFVDREDEALGVVGRGRKVDRIIEAYATLRSEEPT